MEKLKINTTAITVQNETKKHFITGIDFICGIVVHFFAGYTIQLFVL